MAFDACSGKKHRNYCFDVHYYHCFDWWNSKTFGQHLRGIEEHRKELNQFPACVGEWSLAMGDSARRCRCLPNKETRAIFGRAQQACYDEASHGWFFWNWKDGNGPDWDWRSGCGFEQGALVSPHISMDNLLGSAAAPNMSGSKRKCAATAEAPPTTAVPLASASKVQKAPVKLKHPVSCRSKAACHSNMCCGRTKIRVCRAKIAALLARVGAQVKATSDLHHGVLQQASQSLETEAADLEFNVETPPPKKRARRRLADGLGFKAHDILMLHRRCVEKRLLRNAAAIPSAPREMPCDLLGR